jgi:SPP1 gp7 family putative phage head morphogenesis protein
MVSRLEALTQRLLVVRLHELVRDVATPKREDDVIDTLSRILQALSLALGLSDRKARQWASNVLDAVNDHQARAFVDVYSELLALNPFVGNEAWLADQMAVAVEENVRLIRSLATDTLSDVRGVVMRGVLDGTRVEDIALLIASRFDVSHSRATLIATDQVGKWFGSLNRLRQLDAGVVAYEWSTSLDEAVRKSHREREGQQFRWDSPPPDGHPGMPVRCRCQAIAVIEDL